ncbi:MAG: hypothetical protein ACREE7_18300, partial [Dongiaceae bacterium]
VFAVNLAFPICGSILLRHFGCGFAALCLCGSRPQTRSRAWDDVQCPDAISQQVSKENKKWRWRDHDPHRKIGLHCRKAPSTVFGFLRTAVVTAAQV